MQKNIKRLMSLLLSLVLVLGACPSPAYAARNRSDKSASDYRVFAVSEFTSNADLAAKLQNLFDDLVYHSEYHYFTTTGLAGASAAVKSVVESHPTIKKYKVSASKVSGTECYGFGQFVFAYLFGKSLGSYGYETLQKTSNTTQMVLSGDDVTVKKLRSMLLRAVPGDIISMHGSSGPHTMVFLKAKANEDTILVLHNNWTYSKSLKPNDVTIGEISYSQIKSDFGTKVAVYHAKNYESLYPGVKPRLRKVEAKEATCTSEGNIACWYCSACKLHYTSSAHTTAYEGDEWKTPALSHSAVYVPATPATPTSPGVVAHYACSNCGKLFYDEDCTQEMLSGGEELAPPEITVQPENMLVPLGETDVFSVEAEGVGLTYQWFIQYPETDTWMLTDYTESTAPVLGIIAQQGCRYMCEITDSAGSKVQSDAAWLLIDSEDSTALCLPSGLTVVESEAFAETDETYLIVQAGVQTIEAGAFASCKELRYAEFRSASVDIHEGAFAGCTNLTIIAPGGGSVQAYAERNQIPFVPEPQHPIAP